MVATAALDSRATGQAGFSMIELLIAMLITVVVLGSALTVVGGAQNTYRHQLEDVTVEQEGRFALDFIRRAIEPAGSFPYDENVSACTPTVQGIWMNPDGLNGNDDIRIRADAGVPDGYIRGLASPADCTQENEDVTIAHNSVSKTITRYDRAADAAPVAWTDGIFTSLLFEYFDSNMVATVSADSVRVVRVTVTGQSRQRDQTGRFATFTLTSDVRLRAK